jgi:hypothetical protein
MRLQHLAAPGLWFLRSADTGVSSNAFSDPRVAPISVIPAVAKSMNRRGPGVHGVPAPDSPRQRQTSPAAPVQERPTLAYSGGGWPIVTG